ncbi:MAG: hypothetical protein M3Y72_26085, partial [Acidobacteriota bacterium]|nr:hypothetical protein [Acidobacteriota bacterium]
TFQHLFDAIFAGLANYHPVWPEFIQSGSQFERELATVVFGLERAIFDAVLLCPEFLCEMPHGRKEIGDSDFMRQYIIRFPGYFGHPDEVPRRIEPVKGGRFGIELITENYHQVSGPAGHVLLTLRALVRT